MINQIKRYFDYKDRHIDLKKHNIGDEVFLNKGTLLHGTYKNLDGLKAIVNNGLISAWFVDGRLSKYPCAVGLWNLKQIYNNIHSIFGIDKEEFRILISNIIKFFDYKKNDKKEYSINVFSIDVLSKLKSVLATLELTEEQIKKIITKSPIIILYSDNLNNIYYLYKNEKYYGYIVLDNKDYETYLLNGNLSSNIISNNYITDKMLNYYKVKDYTNENFDSLECKFKLKNYYLKKK